MKDFLFVFDLDFTLWDCGGTWCDHSIPPYRKTGNRIFDSSDVEMKLYPDVIHILEELFHSGATIAIASRTSEPMWAEDLMHISGIYPYFHHKEIYPSSKVEHFKALKEKTSYPYERMIFFDDEPRNIHEVSKLGVNCILVNEGLNYEMYKSSCINLYRTEPA
jgi:magnesium-dependent phosphatase 1